MTAVLGMIGLGPLADDLVAYDAPLDGWSRLLCAPLDEPRAVVADLAAALRATCAGDWRQVLDSADAVLVLGAGPDRVDVASAALRAGKPVLVPSLTGTAPETIAGLQVLAAQHGTAFLPAGEFANLSLCIEALSRVARPEFGKLHSIYASARLPRGAAAGDLRRLRWEMLHLVLSAARQKVTRIHVTPGTMAPDAPASAPDAEVIIMRFADDLIATIELAACLPPGARADRLPPIEFEAIGAKQVIRLEPGQTSLRLARDGATELIPFTDPAIIPMLRLLSGGVSSPSTAEPGPAAEVASLMVLADRSRHDGQPVLPA